MLGLRLIGPFLALLVAVIGYGLEYRWDDGRTKKHSWARRSFLAVIVLVFIDSTFWTVLSYRKDAQEEERARADAAMRAQLLEKIGGLNDQLAPFLELALAMYPDKTQENALKNLAKDVTSLQKETVQLRGDLNAVRQLSDIARLNAKGITDTAGAGLKETTPISKALDGAWLEKDGRLYPKCDKESIRKFKNVITLDKRFPFSYYALAECYKTLGDPSWLSYAKEGLSILEKTRTISPHHTHHDEVFHALSKTLTNES